MRLGRGTDIDQVNPLIREQFPWISVGKDGCHIQLRDCSITYVSRNSRKIAVQIASAGIAKGDYPCIRKSCVRLEMLDGHEAGAEDADLNHAKQSGRRKWVKVNLESMTSGKRYRTLHPLWDGPDESKPITDRAIDVAIICRAQRPIINEGKSNRAF